MNNLKEMFDILFLVFVTMVTKVTMGTIVHRVTIVPMISLVTLFFMVAIFTIVICMYSWYMQFDAVSCPGGTSCHNVNSWYLEN